MREFQVGQYGWVLCRDAGVERVTVKYYDDDEMNCICGDRTCLKWWDEKSDELSGHPDHFPVEEVILYDHPDDVGRAGYYVMGVDSIIGSVDSGPSVPPQPRVFDGWIYAIALVPELAPGRIKVGFTSKPIESRLAQHRTANPTAMVIGLWPAMKAWEVEAHCVLTGRIGSSEVFDCDQAEALKNITARLNQLEMRP